MKPDPEPHQHGDGAEPQNGVDSGLQDGFDTVEHDNLSEVVEMLALLERLRQDGLDFAGIAAEMRASTYDPPGGGTWNGPLVAKVLGVVNTVRTEQHPAAPRRPTAKRSDRAPKVQPPTRPPGSPRYSPPGSPRYSPPGSPRYSPPGSPRYSPPGSPRNSPPGSPRNSPPGSPRNSPPGSLPTVGWSAPAPSTRSGARITSTEPAPLQDDDETETSTGLQRLLPGALLVLVIAAGGALAVTAIGDRNTTTNADETLTAIPVADDGAPAEGSAETADGGAGEETRANGDTDDDETAAAVDAPDGTATTIVVGGNNSDGSGSTEADPADMMAIRIEPETPETVDPVTGQPIRAATATIRADGLLHLEGAFPSRTAADRYVSGLADVFGRDNIVETYDINPAAPLPAASDVALDKPVLFGSGTATIDPDYIPFLEACGDVLRLNPHITMSIAAFTDSTGPEELNLELSQRRAQAIHDFYRSVDVSESQLQPLAFGEAEPVADNQTPDGREQNRRAVLRLLGVLAADTGDTATGGN